ncbi:MAG: hypothetical protein M3394_06195 [Actinomycetota bacterium]|nr:hypothetical protein [Actinomycetota bacterium]
MSADEIRRFEAAITPAAVEGGQVIELGLKVGIRDLDAGGPTSPALVAEQAELWAADLDRITTRFSDSPAPSSLVAVRKAFVAALREYAAAARLIGDGAKAEGDRRNSLLDGAVARARAADGLYDDAARRLQRLRREAGLEANPDFPS